MSYFRNRIIQIYTSLVELLFFCFLFYVLSFGRAFSIIHLNTPFVPIFITEIILFICLPFILSRSKFIFELPRVFLIFLSSFFLLGCLYLFFGIMNNNLFAFRDIALCGYIFFVPLSFLIFNHLKNLKLFLLVLFLSNLIALFAGRCLVLNTYPSLEWLFFISKTKFFNFGLYYAMNFSFLFSFYYYFKSKIVRFFILISSSLDLYMLIVFGSRTLWVAMLFLFIFLFVIFKLKAVNLLIRFLPVFIIISSLYLCFDVKSGMFQQFKLIFGKADSMALFLKQPLQKVSAVRELPSNVKYGLDNITWRLSIWDQTIHFSKSSPLIGKGFGIYPKYRIWEKYQKPIGIGDDSNIVPVHNHLLTIFYKMGLLGLVLFLSINFYTYMHGFKYLTKSKSEFTKYFLAASLGVFVFWHTMALFFDVIDSPPTSIFLWIVIGLIFAVIEVDKKYVSVRY